MEALAGAGLMPLPAKSVQNNNSDGNPITNSNSLYPLINLDPVEDDDEYNKFRESLTKFKPYPSLVELQSMIEEQTPEKPATIEPPSIEPLKEFIQKRGETIEGLKDLRTRMAKHVLNCKISNTVGNSASIIGGLLCFVFPPIGVPVLLAGTATSLGMYIKFNSYLLITKFLTFRNYNY